MNNVYEQDRVKKRKTPKGRDQSVMDGSRHLAKAILDTKKLYRQMTIEEQVDAIEYAYGIRAVIRR